MGKKKKRKLLLSSFHFVLLNFFLLSFVGWVFSLSIIFMVGFLTFFFVAIPRAFFSVFFFLFHVSCFMFFFFFNSKASRSVCAWDRCVVRRRGRRSSRSSGVVGLVQ